MADLYASSGSSKFMSRKPMLTCYNGVTQLSDRLGMRALQAGVREAALDLAQARARVANDGDLAALAGRHQAPLQVITLHRRRILEAPRVEQHATARVREALQGAKTNLSMAQGQTQL